ncbi:aldo/keto reductase [Sphingomonas sp. MMS24-J13]|uniref:aldo/keto reductase n=1 Tax=Sphingomonas sp. MMS24-J13 TaxID=3238686 RepID=UPI00384C4101
MRSVGFPDGTAVPMLGQGTWMMGEDPRKRAGEVFALQYGIDLGMTLVDTAEMYADGGSEQVVGEAVRGRRDDVFLVSKAYPHNASRGLLPRACDASLSRLGTDRLDLYLLHWRGNVPLAETVEAMERLVAAGKILRWGVSNLDTDDMEELAAAGGMSCATDQILYNLTRRSPEFDLIPWLRKRSIPIMAYSPVEQGRLVRHPGLKSLAERKGCSPAQLALAWLLDQPGVIAIPKAASRNHVEENRGSADIILDEDDRVALERLFPAPRSRTRLEML